MILPGAIGGIEAVGTAASYAGGEHTEDFVLDFVPEKGAETTDAECLRTVRSETTQYA